MYWEASTASGPTCLESLNQLRQPHRLVSGRGSAFLQHVGICAILLVLSALGQLRPNFQDVSFGAGASAGACSIWMEKLVMSAQP